jgi:MSHA biogenesis protein MshJ
VKKLIQGYADRIDAATLRERVLIFAAFAVLLIALLNALMIEPELVKQKRLSRDVSLRQAQINELQTELQRLAMLRQSDPDREQRKRVEDLRKRVADADASLLEAQRKFVPADKIGSLLEELLSRNRRLQLVDMRTLPTSVVGGEAEKPGTAAKPPVAADKSAAKAPIAAARPIGQIFRHGVELTVTGSYLDLLEYLKDLEKLPNQVYWGALDLAAAPAAKGGTQVTLKLSVFTLSLDLAWLVV